MSTQSKSFESSTENEVTVAHVLQFSVAVGKGMLNISNVIARKLGMEKVVISRLESSPLIEQELSDFGDLYYYSIKEKDLFYNYGDNRLTSETLSDKLADLMGNRGKEALLDAVQIEGMPSEEFLDMLGRTNEIYLKYNN